VPDAEGKFTGVSDCGSIGCRDVKLTRTDVLLWELNWRKLGTAIAEAFGCDGRDADLGIPGTQQIAVAGEGNVPVVLTIQNGQAGLRNAVGLLVARLQGPFVLLAPTRRFVDGVTQGLLANVKAGFFDLESNLTVVGGKLHAAKAGGELFAAHLPERCGTSKGSGGEGASCLLKQGGSFYLFASPAGKPSQASGSVFYKVEGETLAKKLCGLFNGEYGGGESRTDFRCVPAESIPEAEQVLLDEALDWLEVYDDPDAGIYDPEPSKDMMLLAQYAVRARTWEELLRRKLGGTERNHREAVGDDQRPMAQEGARSPEYWIKQEGTRRRAGKQDRTQVSTWRIGFRGHEVLMPTWVGTEYLIFLMRSQGKEFEAGALTQTIRKSTAVGATGSKETANEILHGSGGCSEDGEPAGGRVGDLNERDVIWDARHITDCLRKIKAFEDEVGLHEKARDFSSETYLEAKRMLEEQQDLRAANAKNVNGKWMPKEYQKGTFQRKADVIRKHLHKVLYQHLRDNCRPLFDHLIDRNTLVYGVKNRYQPKPRVDWVVQLMGGKTGM
jgi:hypothetical protein